jgi:hypothetical protein
VIEQRKAKRFELQLPFELVRTGSIKIHQTGETKNLSSVGVLFAAEMRIEIGDPIEYFITLPTPPEADWVRIRCLGKVVRVEDAVIAATLERYEFVRATNPAGSEKPGDRFSQRRKATV